MKKNKLFKIIPFISAISIMAIGCGSNNPNDNILEDVVPSSSQIDTTKKEIKLIYGTIDLPYADFYYGELNNIEPETAATVGQYELSSKIDAAGYRSEGMYDAVTSATKQKSTRFASTFYEEIGDGANIIGVAKVNVAISSELYVNVQEAINSGTICNNELIELVKNLELTDTVPLEYKVINSDGTISKTIGETTIRQDISSTFTTISSWGNYQFNFEGLELDGATVMGGIIETSDGARYGLEHEDNLWLSPTEVSFCAVPFTEPHGNEVAYKRFEDIQGKTITKFTYLIANAPDIEIPVNAYVNLLLDENYYVKSDDSVIYSTQGTTITYSLTVPEDSNFSLSAIKNGRNKCDITNITVDEHEIILPADFNPGKYTLVFEDSVYQALTASLIIDSGLTDGDIIYNGKTFEITKECGLTADSFVKNFESLKVNGESIKAKGLANLIFDENGKILIDAVIESKDGNTPIFKEGDNEVTIASTGFPSVTFTISK